MKFSPLLDELIQSLRCLPGVGPKSAQRMAFSYSSATEKQGLNGVVRCPSAMSDVSRVSLAEPTLKKPSVRFVLAINAVRLPPFIGGNARRCISH